MVTKLSKERETHPYNLIATHQYRPSREEYNSVQRGYNGRAYHTNKQWKANNPERHRANKARAKALELERMRADPKLRAKENQRIRESRARSKARKLAAEERV